MTRPTTDGRPYTDAEIKATSTYLIGMRDHALKESLFDHAVHLSHAIALVNGYLGDDNGQ